MNLEIMVSQLALNYDLTGPQCPTQTFELILLGHHDYPPPEPWEYFQMMVDATVEGGVLGYIFATMMNAAPAGTVMIHLGRKGEELPDEFWILKNQQYLYAIRREFCIRGVIPIVVGHEHVLRAINNRFLARRIYLSKMKS